MKYQIWNEGFSVTGQSSPAQFLGEFEAESFEEACVIAMKVKGWDIKNYYDPERNTFWGCKFYDNEADARKYFG
jgi:hypothetical protein